MKKLFVVLLAVVLFVPILASADTASTTVPAAVAPADVPAVVAPAPVVTVTATATPAAATTNPVTPPDVPAVEANPVGWWQTIVQAIHNKAWAPAIGAILMFLVWGVRKLWSLITNKATSETAKKALPWIALGLGIVLDVGTALTGNIVWYNAIISGFITGSSAIALWEALFKHLLGDATPADPTKPA
jgi:hypothetical protein